MLRQKEFDGRGLGVSVPELAEVIDTTPGQIHNWISEGMPVYKQGGKGRSHILSTAEAIKWLRERENRVKKQGRPPENGNDNNKDRIAALRVERAELELAEKRGDLFHFSDYSPFIEDRIVSARTELCEIPNLIREEFSDVSRIGAIVRFANQQIVAVCNRLASRLAQVPAEIANAR